MRIRYIIATILCAITVLFIMNIVINKKDANVASLPSLPKPIAKEYALITSAGQNTDVYIVNDIANKLMIHNFFMPQAEVSDLDSINTLVFVVGRSSIGEKLHGTSYNLEKKRVLELVEKAREKEIAVIAVYIGGKQQHNNKTDELLTIVTSAADYLIGTKDANGDGVLSDLAKTNKIPLTLVSGVSDLSEPFASAFR